MYEENLEGGCPARVDKEFRGGVGFAIDGRLKRRARSYGVGVQRHWRGQGGCDQCTFWTTIEAVR